MILALSLAFPCKVDEPVKCWGSEILGKAVRSLWLSRLLRFSELSATLENGALLDVSELECHSRK